MFLINGFQIKVYPPLKGKRKEKQENEKLERKRHEFRY